ncbi:hypothetical protein SAMN02745866_01013 [Alteromonadaceae bacterium Bs31]|nr:hypothetical protein SAMN02745866_01013 [Alteromonadaceae bacterium Bs31]
MSYPNETLSQAPVEKSAEAVKPLFSIDGYLRVMANAKLHDALYYTSFLLLGVLLIMPLWTVTYLPLGDLADHAAQLRTILDFEAYQQNYRINWFTPYWVGYGFALFFSLFFSVVTALKIVLSLALLAYPLAAAWLIHELKGNRFWVWSAFPCAWGFTVYWGFLSFTVATPIAIAFLAFTVRYAQAQLNWRYVLGAAVFSIFLFFSHALAWLFAVGVACSVLFIYNSFERSKLKAWAFMAAVPVVLLWISFSSDGSGSVESGRYVEHLMNKTQEIWGAFANQYKELAKESGHWNRTKEFFSFSIGKPAMLDYSLLGLLCLLWPKFTGARFSRNWRRWVPLLSAFAAFLLVPYWIFDTAYVYYRFSVFLIPFGYFIFDARPQPQQDDEQAKPESASTPLKKQIWQQVYYVAGVLIVASILLSVNSLIATFKENDAQFKDVLGEMEPGKRVMMMVFNGDSAMRFSPAYSHFVKYYQAEKLGEVLPAFSHDEHADNVPIRYRHKFIQAPSVWNPNDFNWRKHQGAKYDYFVIRANSVRRNMFRDSKGDIVLITESGPWHLYGKKEYLKSNKSKAEAMVHQVPP